MLDQVNEQERHIKYKLDEMDWKLGYSFSFVLGGWEEMSWGYDFLF